MKLLSTIETFIKQQSNRNFMPTFIGNHRLVRQTIGSLLTVIALIGLSGVVATFAEAPSEEELASINEGFATEAERAEALQRLAVEIKQITYDRQQILWLARVLYSETKRADEMPYIGWVIRNRVDIGHRSFDADAGVNNYKGAALAKSQFTGMNPGLDKNATKNLAMSYETVGVPSWDTALSIAEQVYYADDSERVLPQDTTHFYSPFIAPPAWAQPHQEVHQTITNRFRFFAVK